MDQDRVRRLVAMGKRRAHLQRAQRELGREIAAELRAADAAGDLSPSEAALHLKATRRAVYRWLGDTPVSAAKHD